MLKKELAKSKIIIIPLVFTALLIVMFFTTKPTITGRIAESDTVIDGVFNLEEITVIPLTKAENSAVEVKASTDPEVMVFVETNDCALWQEKKSDEDDLALMAEVVDANTEFKVGDPSQNTKQQIELYKADRFCFVVFNKDGAKSLTLNGKQVEKDIWTIV